LAAVIICADYLEKLRAFNLVSHWNRAMLVAS